MPSHPDSPAASSTSRKAATLSHSRRHQRSSSFPFIKSLNPFKRKPSPPPPCTDEGPAEPYEVAPGIWSTDATAKVFGYLDPPEDNRKKRTKSAGPDKRNRFRHRSDNDKARGCSPARRLVERYKEAHTDDGLDDFRGRTHRRKVEECDRKRQERRDEAKKEREESERRGRRGRMLTVDQEDELIIRGANPRTGIVTPWEGSQASGEGGSWLSRGRGDILGPGKSRESSGKWTQEEHGWSLIQDAGSSPGQQAGGGKPTHGMSVKDLEDKFVVSMPGVDDPDPPSVTAEQICIYQEGVERAYSKAEGSHGLVDPETLPSPRAETPEGPSTPPSKLQKIRRKEVGSATNERNNSTDTVVVTREATVPTAIPSTFRDGTRRTPSFNVIPPSSTASPALKCPERGHRALPSKQIHTQRAFLGPLPDEEKSPIANVTPSLCLLSTAPKPSPLRQVESDHAEATFAPQQLFRTLSQYLPPLSFLHPSYFANLPEPYGNPRSRPRESPKKSLDGQYASTITTPIITTPITTPIITTTTEKKQRARVVRQGGTDSVPRANLRAFEVQKKWWEQQQQQQQQQQKKTGVIMPEIKKSHGAQNMNPSSAAQGAQGVEAKPPPANQNWEKGEKYNGWVVPDPSADDPKAPILEENVGGTWKGRKSTSTCICMKCRTRRFRGSKPTPTTERTLESQSGNTIAEQIPKKKDRDGVGCIRTDDRPGDATVCGGHSGRTSGLRLRAMANERRRRVEELEASEEPELEVRLDGEAIVDGDAWCAFTGRWRDEKGKADVACRYDGAEEKGGEGREDGDEQEGEERLGTTLTKAMADVWNAVCEMEKSFHASGTATRVYRRVSAMVQHVLITLKPASPALQMLRRKDARVEDYLRAVRDLVLAGVYLLVLLNMLMTVGKAVRLSMKVLLCAWWPVKVALVMVRCFALG